MGSHEWRAHTLGPHVRRAHSSHSQVTLDHLYRDQLVAMAQFLNMNHFAPTGLLRFQVRQRLKRLRSEDKDIMWEGIDGLSEAELKLDLRNRGIPARSNMAKPRLAGGWPQLATTGSSD